MTATIWKCFLIGSFTFLIQLQPQPLSGAETSYFVSVCQKCQGHKITVIVSSSPPHHPHLGEGCWMPHPHFHYTYPCISNLFTLQGWGGKKKSPAVQVALFHQARRKRNLPLDPCRPGHGRPSVGELRTSRERVELPNGAFFLPPRFLSADSEPQAWILKKKRGKKPPLTSDLWSLIKAALQNRALAGLRPLFLPLLRLGPAPLHLRWWALAGTLFLKGHGPRWYGGV